MTCKLKQLPVGGEAHVHLDDQFTHSHKWLLSQAHVNQADAQKWNLSKHLHKQNVTRDMGDMIDRVDVKGHVQFCHDVMFSKFYQCNVFKTSLKIRSKVHFRKDLINVWDISDLILISPAPSRFRLKGLCLHFFVIMQQVFLVGGSPFDLEVALKLKRYSIREGAWCTCAEEIS